MTGGFTNEFNEWIVAVREALWGSDQPDTMSFIRAYGFDAALIDYRNGVTPENAAKRIRFYAPETVNYHGR